MRYLALLALLCATLAAAQGAPGTTPQRPAAPAPVAPAPVAPDTPVITIEGYCPATESGKVQLQNALAPPCRMVVTREQFERLAKAISPEAKPAEMTRFAHAYAQYMVAANDAIKLGLDKSPEAATLLDYLRLQALSTVLQNHYRDDVKNISDAELQSYYNDNVAQFEEIQLERLYVPKAVNGQRQDEAAVKAKAEALRARAAAGEAFDALQKEAWGTNQQAPPPTKVGPLRRGAMPTPLENQIFALKVGEISPVLDEQPGYYIIRMIGRRTLPFADVKDQIHDQLEKKKFADLMRGVLELKPALNPSYFTTPAPGSQP
ncbi:MAG TPA: peptidylprolyl isomerase [Terriglobales bacterium]|nr:peptidylprolyl isomerase [Terriglobales bacterium]